MYSIHTCTAPKRIMVLWELPVAAIYCLGATALGHPVIGNLVVSRTTALKIREQKEHTGPWQSPGSKISVLLVFNIQELMLGVKMVKFRENGIFGPKSPVQLRLNNEMWAKLCCITSTIVGGGGIRVTSLQKFTAINLYYLNFTSIKIKLGCKWCGTL